MTMDSKTLADCQTLVALLRAGDASAWQTAKALKSRALAGDERARLAWATASALYWGADPSTGAVESRFEILYKGMANADPQALAIFTRMKSLAQGGDARAANAVATLKAIHNRNKKSVWYPGAPRTGYYPMPSTHRAGIEIPGPSRVVIGADPGAPMNIPGLPSLPGNLPMPLPQIPQGNLASALPAAAAAAAQMIPGASSLLPAPVPIAPAAPMAGSYLPLDAATVQRLLAMINSARGLSLGTMTSQSYTADPAAAARAKAAAALAAWNAQQAAQKVAQLYGGGVAQSVPSPFGLPTTVPSTATTTVPKPVVVNVSTAPSALRSTSILSQLKR